MKSREEIERAVDETLNSLDGFQPAEANEFLYTRIVSRMQQARQELAARNHRLMLRLGLCLGLFVCVNGLSFYFLSKPQASDGKRATTGTSAFAKEYQLDGREYSY